MVFIILLYYNHMHFNNNYTVGLPFESSSSNFHDSTLCITWMIKDNMPGISEWSLIVAWSSKAIKKQAIAKMSWIEVW